MNIELVIAAYNEDLDWVKLIDESVNIKIYRKGDEVPLNDGEIRIEPNMGRCVHTFFKHIYENYENMSDITFFVQDYPFDHWENMVDVINNKTWDSDYTLKIDGYYGFHNNTIGTAGFKWKWPLKKGGGMWTLLASTQHGNGCVLICQPNGLPHDRNPNINVNKYWLELFDGTPPSQYEFMPGGHFGITKETVKFRSKSFYKKITEILESDVNAPWIIERLECYIFNKKFKSKYDNN